MAKIYIYLALVAVAFAVAWGIYSFGYDNAMTKAQADQVQAIKSALEDAEVKRQKDATVVEKLAVKKADSKVKYRTITKEVIRYVQTHDDTQCLDPDGVRIWNAASAGATPEATPQPAPAVP